MRYSYAALVLATAFVSRVAAGPVKHAHQHAHFHAKKDAELVNVEAEVEKREAEPGLQDVDWSTVHYTYSVGQTWGQPTAAPAVVPAPAATTPVAAPAVQTPAPVSAAKASDAAAPAKAILGISTSLIASHVSKLADMGVKAAINALTPGNGIWIGSDGPYTNEFTNASPEDIILVVWGAAGSWINAIAPSVTVSLSPGQSTTLSFANGVSGAWSGIYSDTQMVNGQIANTWGEFTFSPMGVVDVSREVYMKGRSMTIQAPTCTSDMNRCVFVCGNGEDSCMYGYKLLNCDASSQQGAQYGQDNGADSGGCGNLGSSAHIKTTLS